MKLEQLYQISYTQTTASIHLKTTSWSTKSEIQISLSIEKGEENAFLLKN